MDTNNLSPLRNTPNLMA